MTVDGAPFGPSELVILKPHAEIVLAADQHQPRRGVGGQHDLGMGFQDHQLGRAEGRAVDRHRAFDQVESALDMIGRKAVARARDQGDFGIDHRRQGCDRRSHALRFAHHHPHGDALRLGRGERIGRMVREGRCGFFLRGGQCHP